MKPIVKVLIRCLAVEFYKQNAAFFGLLFLVLFGFIKTSEHIAIGSFLVANPAALFYLYLLWIAYGIKVILFVIPALNKEENQFLEVFSLLPLKIKIKAIGWLSIMFLIPVLAYSVFLLTLALPHKFYLSASSLISFVTILIGILLIVLYKRLNSLQKEKSFVKIRFLNKLTKPSYLFFIEHLIRNDFVLLFLSKTYTCLILIGTTALYSTDQFDLRLLSTGVLLAYVGNVAILHKYIWFYHHKMSLLNNLPELFSKIAIKHIVTFMIIMSPEAAVIIRHYPISPTVIDVFGIIAFGLSIIVLIYGMLILKQLELSDFVIKIFWLIVLTTFLILFSIHPLILSILYIFISLTIIYFRRYKFEFIEKSH